MSQDEPQRSKGNRRKRRYLESKRGASASPKQKVITAPVCPYCGRTSELRLTSESVYRKDYGPVWCCPGHPVCDAFVGCHPGTHMPLGRLAQPALRKLKIQAHEALDLLWKTKADRNPDMRKGHARAQAYIWLAAQLGIPAPECHIGMFDEARCQAAIDVLRPWFIKVKRSLHAQARAAR